MTAAVLIFSKDVLFHAVVETIIISYFDFKKFLELLKHN